MTRRPALMTKALTLTRSGKLSEATALIQRVLRGDKDAAQSAAPSDDAIEGSFTRLPAAAGAKERDATTPHGKRSPLAETLRSIPAGGMPRRAPLSAKPVDVASGAEFLTRTHQSAAGSRTYRLYIPARQGDATMPLVVMLHGCTQTPEDFALGTGMNALAEEFGCIIAYPAQPTGASMQKCWNWFRPEDQGRDRGEPALIAGLTRDVLRDTRADPARVYIAGLSAGGAAAAIVAAAYPDIFSAVGVHSGLPLGAAQDVASAFAAMRSGAAAAGSTPVPTISFHGLADSTVHPANGQAVVAQALTAKDKARPTTTKSKAPGGRSYSRTRHGGPDGRSIAEHWEIEGAGHAWAGGNPAGSYTDPAGPDASREMLAFFLQHKKA